MFDIKKLYPVVDPEAATSAAEIRFHTALTASCDNRLATLFTHMYGPLFSLESSEPPSAADIRAWIEAHELMVEALETRDEPRFLTALKAHTHKYMRLNTKEIRVEAHRAVPRLLPALRRAVSRDSRTAGLYLRNRHVPMRSGELPPGDESADSWRGYEMISRNVFPRKLYLENRTQKESHDN